MYSKTHKSLAGLLICAALAMAGCSSSSSSGGTAEGEPFSVQFAAMVGDLPLNCTDTYTGFGPAGEYTIGVSDLRFFVSNLQFYDTDGVAIKTTLEANDNNVFQLNHAQGSVALIDFAAMDSGFCADAANGTARTNTEITGKVADTDIASVSFDVGLPQAVMKAVIAANDSVTDAPSPLQELHWSWATGYRHFVLDFAAMDATHTGMVENSSVHIGSRDCGSVGKALAERETCGLVNTPRVWLGNFDPEDNQVVVDIGALLRNAQTEDFDAGDNFGLQCHSGQAQTACQSLFPNFGLDIVTGEADATYNIVFTSE